MRSRRSLVLVLLTLLAAISLVGALSAQNEEPASVPAPEAAGPQFSNSILLPMVKNSPGAASEALSAAALAMVAADNGLSAADLSVANEATATYELTARVGYDFKFVDTVTGQVYGIMLDGNGNRLDAAQLEAAESAAYQARYGVYEPELADMLAAGQVSGAQRVIIWLKEPDYTPPARPAPTSDYMSDAQLSAFAAVADVQRAEHVARVNAPVLSRMAAMGLQAEGDRFAPAIYTSLDASNLRAVGGWSEVDTIYLDRNDNMPLDTDAPDLNVARSTIYAHTVHGRGFTGSGVKVGVIEVGGRAATNNPYMSITQDPLYACAAAQSHATAVAGMVRSTHSTYRGIAYGSQVRVGGSCGGWDSELTSRSTAAVDWGARILNLSWGGRRNRVVGSLERFYDNMVINRWITVVAAAGNEGSGCGGNGQILTPAMAYNIISVGNFNDQNSQTWNGDAMSSCSSWWDPISTRNDREKPEVAAPGSNIISLLTASPWYGNTGSGTSYASPMVAGTAALMMQRNTGLRVWPEAVKAITMATAVHNVEGGTRLSEKDGAGGLITLRADDAARNYNWAWKAQPYTCSTASPLEVFTFNSPANYRLRFVITWDNPPSYSNYANQPSADLDLVVIGPSGTAVASSASYDNTYEIVDFRTPAAGTYRVRVNRFRCNASPVYLGFAATAHDFIQ